MDGCPSVDQVMHSHHFKGRIRLKWNRNGIWHTLWLPGGFCDSSNVVDQSMFAINLQSHMKTSRGLPSRYTVRPTCIPKDLTACTHVFVLPILWYLSCIPYGQINSTLFPGSGHTDTLSPEWLKAAFLDSDYTTGDSFTETPVSVRDIPRSLDNGDHNTSQTFDPPSTTTARFDRKIFKPDRFVLSQIDLSIYTHTVDALGGDHCRACAEVYAAWILEILTKCHPGLSNPGITWPGRSS